ncbi:MAG: prepilin-type N-terminal cleavage/methylation domain-containing protein [Candidatus Cloacimonas sp.]
MKCSLLNEKGFTLFETIAVIVISTILMVVATMGIGIFFRKYQELNAYVDLQKDSAAFLNILKYGYHIGSRSSDIEFEGVTSAKQLTLINMTTIPGVSKGIQITPPLTNQYPDDYVKYYLHDGVIKMDYRHHGTDSPSAITIFPQAGSKDKVIIEDFLISDANANNAIFQYMTNENLCVINVELKTKVQIRENEFRSVHFKTTMAMKNMERPSSP